MKKRMALTASAVLLGVLWAGCGEDEKFRSFDEIKEHLDNPTAQVNSTNVKQAFTLNAEAGGDALGALSQLPGLPISTVAILPGNIALPVPQQLRRYFRTKLPLPIQQDLLDGCIDKSMSQELSYNMSTFSGGTVTGDLTVTIEGAGTCDYEVVIELNEVCAEGVCANGAMGYQIKLDSLAPLKGTMLSSTNVTITGQGHEATLESGTRTTIDENASSGAIEFLAFIDVDGESQSIVIEFSADATSGSVTVRGANGSFTCSYANEGASGSCSNSAGVEVSWS